MHTLSRAKEHVEAPRSIFRESMPPGKFPNFVVLMSSIIDSEYSVHEATNHQVWWDAIVQDDAWEIMLGSEGQPVPGGSSRSTFLAKRECRCL
jgi:hypothetical protein